MGACEGNLHGRWGIVWTSKPSKSVSLSSVLPFLAASGPCEEEGSVHSPGSLISNKRFSHTLYLRQFQTFDNMVPVLSKAISPHPGLYSIGTYRAFSGLTIGLVEPYKSSSCLMIFGLLCILSGFIAGLIEP